MQKKTRQEKEDALWRDTFDQFKSAWNTRTNDLIERGHPQEFWAWKQRKKYRDGSLLGWRKDLLLSIGFPFEAVRMKAQNDNMSHARSLHDFYDKHGHFAPTITIGGGALTHWVRRMRESNGTSGIATDEAGSAEKACDYLKAQIPGFSWARTEKCDYNFSQGKTHNGYQPSSPKKRIKSIKPGSRIDEVVQRARASKLFRCPPNICFVKEDYGIPLHDFLLRCAFYEQAARVHLITEDDFEVWWLEDLEFNDDNGKYLTFKLALPHSHQDASGTITRKVVLWPADGRQKASYTLDGSHFIARLDDPASRSSMTLDMDVLLADQTHQSAHPLRWRSKDWLKTPDAWVNWEKWSDPRTFPENCASTLTTANVAFNRNLISLRKYLSDHQSTEENPYYIPWQSRSWAYGADLFKFLEHMVRKVDHRTSCPSHRERLSELHFTWGASKFSAIELFSHIPAKANPRGTSLALNFEQDKNRSLVDNAYVAIDEFIKKVNMMDKRVIFNGVFAHWANLYRVENWGSMLAISYTYKNSNGSSRKSLDWKNINYVYVTEEDLEKLTVTDNGIHGYSKAGHPFEMFIAEPMRVQPVVQNGFDPKPVLSSKSIATT